MSIARMQVSAEHKAAGSPVDVSSTGCRRRRVAFVGDSVWAVDVVEARAPPAPTATPVR